MNLQAAFGKLWLLSPANTVEIPGSKAVLRDLLLLTAVSFLVLLPDLGQTRRLENRESRHAEIIRQMARSGDYVVPSLLGHTYRDKPPVMHIMAAIVTKWVGKPSMTIARLPSALAGCVVVLAAYGVGRILCNRVIALVGSLALLGMPGFVGMARQVRPDMILCAGITLSCLALLFGMRETRAALRLTFFGLAGLAAGVGVLAKGPWGILFPGLFAALASVRRSELKLPRSGWLVFLAGVTAIVATWVVPAYLRDGGVYLKEILTQPDLEVGSQSWEPLHRYLSGGLALTLPLSLFLPVVLRDWWRRGRRGYSPLLVFALLVVVIFCFIPKKRPHYVLPMYPFFALGIVGTILEPKRTGTWIRRGGVGLIYASVLAMPLYFAVIQRFVEPAEDLRIQVAKRFIANTEENARVYVLAVAYIEESLAWVADQHNLVIKIDGPDASVADALQSAPTGSYLATTSDELPALQKSCPSLSIEPIQEARLTGRTMLLCRLGSRSANQRPSTGNN